MSLCEVNGIVVYYVNYGESDRIIHLYTAERGLISALARGARKPNSALLNAVQPLVYGKYVLFENKGKYTVNTCELLETFYNARIDMDKFSAAMYMTSLMNNRSHEFMRSRRLFFLLYYSLTYISYKDECVPRDIAIAFLVKVLNEHGFIPQVKICGNCGRVLLNDSLIYFEPFKGHPLCFNCKTPESVQVEPTSLEAIVRILRLNVKDVYKVKMPLRISKELFKILNTYAETVLEEKFNGEIMFYDIDVQK